jgi:hypothetical protein
MTQAPDIKFQLPIEVLCRRRGSEGFTIILLEDGVRFGLVGEVGVNTQEFVYERALAAAMSSRYSDSH